MGILLEEMLRESASGLSGGWGKPRKEIVAIKRLKKYMVSWFIRTGLLDNIYFQERKVGNGLSKFSFHKLTQPLIKIKSSPPHTP